MIFLCVLCASWVLAVTLAVLWNAWDTRQGTTCCMYCHAEQPMRRHGCISYWGCECGNSMLYVVENDTVKTLTSDPA